MQCQFCQMNILGPRPACSRCAMDRITVYSEGYLAGRRYCEERLCYNHMSMTAENVRTEAYKFAEQYVVLWATGNLNAIEALEKELKRFYQLTNVHPDHHEFATLTSATKRLLERRETDITKGDGSLGEHTTLEEAECIALECAARALGMELPPDFALWSHPDPR